MHKTKRKTAGAQPALRSTRIPRLVPPPAADELSPVSPLPAAGVTFQESLDRSAREAARYVLGPVANLVDMGKVDADDSASETRIVCGSADELLTRLVSEAFGQAYTIAAATRWPDSLSPAQFVFAWGLLAAYRSRVKDECGEARKRWPHTPGVRFAGHCGSSALERMIGFADAVYVAGLLSLRHSWGSAGRLHPTTAIFVVSEPVSPEIATWFERTIDELQHHTLLPADSWSGIQMREDAEVLAGWLRDESSRASEMEIRTAHTAGAEEAKVLEYHKAVMHILGICERMDKVNNLAVRSVLTLDQPAAAAVFEKVKELVRCAKQAAAAGELVSNQFVLCRDGRAELAGLVGASFHAIVMDRARVFAERVRRSARDFGGLPETTDAADFAAVSQLPAYPGGFPYSTLRAELRREWAQVREGWTATERATSARASADSVADSDTVGDAQSPLLDDTAIKVLWCFKIMADRNRNATQGEICAALAKDKKTVAARVDHLRECGLLDGNMITRQGRDIADRNPEIGQALASWPHPIIRTTER